MENAEPYDGRNAEGDAGRNAGAAGARPRVRLRRRDRMVMAAQRRVVNPVARRLTPYTPGAAVIETTGRHSGMPRLTPIGGRLEGAAFWWVSEFGRNSQYVRNIAADPRVRLQIKRRWYTGTAVILDEDDPRQRLRHLPRLNSLTVRTVGSSLLTLRVDLDPPPGETA